MKITSAMGALAKGDRLIAIRGAERRDEIGEMSRALAVFRRSADDLVHFQEQAAVAAQRSWPARKPSRPARRGTALARSK